MMRRIFLYIFALHGFNSMPCSGEEMSQKLNSIFSEIEQILDDNLGIVQPRMDTLLLNAKTLTDALNNQHSSAYYNYLEGKTFFERRKLKEAIEPIMNALVYFSLNGNNLERGKVYFQAGVVYEQGGMFYDAHEYYIKALEQFKETNSKRYLGYTSFGLARTSRKMGRASEEYIKSAEGYLLNSGDKRLEANYWTQKALLETSKKQKSIYFWKSKKLYHEIGHDINEFLTLANLSNISYTLQNLDSVEIYINQAHRIASAKHIPDEFLTNLFLVEAGAAYNKKLFDQSRMLFNRARLIAIENNQKRFVMGAYQGLIACELQNGNYKKAYGLLKKLNNLEKEINEERRTLSALLVDAQYKDRERQKEIMALKVRIRWVVSLSIFIFLIITATILYWRRRKNRAIKKQEIELKKILGKVHKEHVMVDGLQSQIGRIIRREGGKLKDSLENISEQLDKIKFVDTERDEFLSVFDNFFEVAFKKLNKEYPMLSRTDCRYALLLALGLPNQTIAKLTGIQSDSMRKIKQRMREKLNLKTSEDLILFLNNLVISRKIPRLAEFGDKISILAKK